MPSNTVYLLGIVTDLQKNNKINLNKKKTKHKAKTHKFISVLSLPENVGII